MATTTHTPLPERIDSAPEPSGPRKARRRIATRGALTWAAILAAIMAAVALAVVTLTGGDDANPVTGAHSELAPNHYPHGFGYSSGEYTGDWKDSLLDTKAGDPASTGNRAASKAEADRYVEWLESRAQQAATTPTAADAERIERQAHLEGQARTYGQRPAATPAAPTTEGDDAEPEFLPGSRRVPTR
jgi:hypothetical protein